MKGFELGGNAPAICSRLRQGDRQLLKEHKIERHRPRGIEIRTVEIEMDREGAFALWGDTLFDMGQQSRFAGTSDTMNVKYR